MDDNTRYLRELIEEMKKLRQEVSNLSRQLNRLDSLESEVREFRRLYDKRSYKR